MNCIKHHTQVIPCIICAKEEYELYKNDPRHDFTDVKKFLKEKGVEF